MEDQRVPPSVFPAVVVFVILPGRTLDAQFIPSALVMTTAEALVDDDWFFPRATHMPLP